MAARKGNRAFLWIVVGVLGVSLLGFGTGGFTGRVDSVGAVAGREVPAQSYANALSAQIRDFEEQFEQPLSFEEAQTLGIDRAVLARLVTEATLDAEAARLGLSAGDARVRDAVLAVQAFQGLDGAFDRETYAEQLRRMGQDEAAFEAGLRDRAARTLLQTAVLGGLPAPDAAAGALSAFWGERRVVTWARVAAADVAVPDPTPEDLRAEHEANPDAYTAPERRAITAAWLDVDTVAEAQEIDEATLRDDYEARLADFVQEERRLVERLVYPSEEAAAEARARLDAGEATFEALVEERGLTLAAIDLGDVARADLGAAAEAAFGAEAGDVVGPVATNLGPALLRINAVLAAQETTFDEARDELRAERAADLARRAISDAVPGIEDLVAGGATVEDLAERAGMEIVTLDGAAGDMEGLAAYDAFREAAQAATEGAPPRLVELDDGGVFALRVDAITPPALRPFEEVEAEVEAAWRARAGAEAALARAEASAAAIAGGATFEAEGLAPVTEPPLTRRDPVEGAPPGLAERAFAVAPGEAVALPAEGGAVVLRLDAVEPPAADDPATVAERAAQAAELSRGVADDVFAAFAGRLQADAEVRLDDAAIAAVHAQLR